MKNTMIQKIDQIIDNLLIETQEYKAKQKKEHRREKSQFFSSQSIAGYMAKQIEIPEKKSLKVLDPGAGNGLLAVMMLRHILEVSMPESIEITFVENDKDILPILHSVSRQLIELNKLQAVKIVCAIQEDNFITDFSSSSYDIVICNPPYAKITKKSREAEKLAYVVYGQPNLYALFAVKAVSLLNEGGQYVFITPRSWTSGYYFVKVREFLFNTITIRKIHLFNYRENVFSNEDILQETMIWSGSKGKGKEDIIRISTSENDGFKETSSIDVPFFEIVSHNEDKYLLLPLKEEDYELLKSMNGLRDTFDSLGYVFRTGPVVEFRKQELLSPTRTPQAIPMFRAANVKDGKFVFPANTEKAQYIDTTKEPLLRFENTPTILVKRLSAKEEKRRLQCCAYIPIPSEPYVSLENHVNYLTKKDGGSLTEDEVSWAFSVISSEKYDRYFRMINGSTQVNAKDLNMLPVTRRLI